MLWAFYICWYNNKRLQAMSAPTLFMPTQALIALGLRNTSTINYQLSSEELVEDVLKRREGKLSDAGALVINTGAFTGRSPKDKYIVKDEITDATVFWNNFNIAISEHHFEQIKSTLLAHLNNQPNLWVRDSYACADSRYRVNIRIVSEQPSMNLFAYNMFLRPTEEELDNFEPEWTILSAPGLQLNAALCGTRQENAAVISFKHKTILIAGTGYTGETKKGIFTILNYILPHQKNVLSMHCAANSGKQGDTALFFGLSGTGKTTLSADPDRKLIGDDEHGWGPDGIFNFEGGCYAKTIDLSEEKEPAIFHAIKAGALVENTPFYEGTHTINFSSKTITENTRVSYPLSFISNAEEPSIGNIPKHIFFLTCDAYGVLPPISQLTPAQAMYQFISGYTAKVAGTEAGITKPCVTFSACFGAPFLPLHPSKYAHLLGEKIKQHQVKIWMINTGWSGGGVGVGNRMKLSYTRSMITAALNNQLNTVGYEVHPVFGMMMPLSCPEIPSRLLNPRNTWANKTDYDTAAKKLALLFIENFKQYADGVATEVLAAAPRAER
jgi:phosphoenolpyruvate carboxykinase (ATP)